MEPAFHAQTTEGKIELQRNFRFHDSVKTPERSEEERERNAATLLLRRNRDKPNLLPEKPFASKHEAISPKTPRHD
ncbi:hypothetical protein NPIL_477981 [Nephila pilipes]|uniref:Uncharacterized protein n=1 Tax=Nephila pilipes TaxID=299642 RepID=A0A8X6PXJ5_NEPPI|nr:hypothetical protein NPIL_477981 [Nephila pilipes]